jgi:peptide/nickel transport system ATP-binding protein
MIGLQPVTGGRVALEGRDLSALSGADRLWLRQRVHMIFQDPLSSLSPRFRIRDLLEEPLHIHDRDVVAHWPGVLATLRRLGLSEAVLPKYPHQVSGGQARRIAIARALVPDPALIVADEPTAGLDVSVQGELLNLLNDLKREKGIGLLMVSHNLGVVGRVTDRVAVMYLGQIVEEGRTRDVFRKPRHPYTRALLSASPVVDPVRRRPRIILRGDVPSPTNPPPACRFHTRCPKVQPICRSEAPRLEGSKNHRFACHFPE